VLRRNRDLTSFPVSSVRCSIPHRRRTIGRPDLLCCSTAPPHDVLRRARAGGTFQHPGPRALPCRRRPDPAVGVAVPRLHPNPEPGEHHHDPLSLALAPTALRSPLQRGNRRRCAAVVQSRRAMASSHDTARLALQSAPEGVPRLECAPCPFCAHSTTLARPECPTPASFATQTRRRPC